MIYRIRNPFTYKDKKTVTELDAETGEVWHCDAEEGRRRSQYPISYWTRVLSRSDKDLENEHVILEQLEACVLDEGL